MHLTYLCHMLEIRDVQRFMCRAGIQVGTDAAMGKVQQAFAEFVRDIQRAAIVSMESDQRLTVYAKDITAALSTHPSRIRLYGFDDVVEGQGSCYDSDDEASSDGDASESVDDLDEETSSDDDNDEESAAEVDELFDDGSFGDGEYSDAEDSTKHAAQYTDEDALWDASDDGYVRLDAEKMQLALSRDVSTPYVVSRHVLLQMWMALTTLEITRPALSALHNAVEHYINRELVDGKLGSLFMYTVMENLVVEQAAEADRLEAELVECRATMAQVRAARKRGRGGLREGSVCHENVPLPPTKPSSSSSPLKHVRSKVNPEDPIETAKKPRFAHLNM